MYQEKQGLLEDLGLLPLPQLEYLLKRQERILKNEKLLKTLPDGGLKTKTFVETLKTEIRSRESVDSLSTAFENQVRIQPKSPNKIVVLSEEGEIKSKLEIEERSEIEESGSDRNSIAIEASTVVESSVGERKTKKTSKFKSERLTKGKRDLDAVRRAREEDAAEKRNVLIEIFGETRVTEPVKPRFKENVPVKTSDVKSIPKPISIQRLVAQRPHRTNLITELPEDCLHPPSSRLQTTRVIGLAESLTLQEKLKSTHECRMAEDAAARLVDRLRGQALPERAEPARPWVAGDPEVVSRLLGSRLKGEGNSSAAVEGQFIEYREKRDADDLDDALYDEVIRQDEGQDSLS